MPGQAQGATVSEYESANSAAAPEDFSHCGHRQEYAAFSFTELLKRLTKAAGCPLSPDCTRQAEASPLNKTTLLLLPLCSLCALARDCSNDARCVCGNCTSLLLLLLLLRICTYRLAAASSERGVLLCGCEDTPARRADFFPLLLAPEDQWPWSASEEAGAAPRERTRTHKCVDDIRISSRKEAFLALTRVGYKLLDCPEEVLAAIPDTKQSAAAAATGPPQPPPLLRVMAELPEALRVPTAFLLVLRPSRWLTPVRRAPCPASTALQSLANKKVYGLFLALLLRAEAADSQLAPNVPKGTFRGAAGMQGQQTAFPGCAVVAECFLCCPSCCWRCSRQRLRIGATRCVSLCCLEQSEWLCLLRSRFSQVLLLFYAAADSQMQNAYSAGQSFGGTPEEQKAAALFVADVTDVAFCERSGERAAV